MIRCTKSGSWGAALLLLSSCEARAPRDAQFPDAILPPPPEIRRHAAASTEDASDGGLSINTEIGSWSETIRALDVDMHSQGRTVHIEVARGDGPKLGCDAYTLALENVSSSAFSLGRCENGLTPLTVLSRSELFDHSEVISKPREVRILATERRVTTVTSGPPSSPVGVTCGIALKPFVDDIEKGTRVELLPSRFTLHATAIDGGSDITVETAGDGWRIHGGSALTVRYEVVDNKTGHEILTDRATLTCDDVSSGDHPEDPSPSMLREDANAPLTALTPPTREKCIREKELLELERAQSMSLGIVHEWHVSERCSRLVGDLLPRGDAGKRPNGPGYVAGNIVGSIFIAGSAAAFVGGLASATSSTPHAGRSIALINIFPHLLTAGIITLAVNQSSNSAAKVRAKAFAWAPTITPTFGSNGNGVVGGFGHSF